MNNNVNKSTVNLIFLTNTEIIDDNNTSQKYPEGIFAAPIDKHSFNPENIKLKDAVKKAYSTFLHQTKIINRWAGQAALFFSSMIFAIISLFECTYSNVNPIRSIFFIISIVYTFINGLILVFFIMNRRKRNNIFLVNLSMIGAALVDSFRYFEIPDTAFAIYRSASCLTCIYFLIFLHHNSKAIIGFQLFLFTSVEVLTSLYLNFKSQKIASLILATFLIVALNIIGYYFAYTEDLLRKRMFIKFRRLFFQKERACLEKSRSEALVTCSLPSKYIQQMHCFEKSPPPKTRNPCRTLDALSMVDCKLQRHYLSRIPNNFKTMLNGKFEHIEYASVLFADIVNFTEFAASKTAEEVVEVLSKFFDYFDHMTTVYQIEKIQTIGDCYVACAGVPNAVHDAKAAAQQAEKLCVFALQMIDIVEYFSHILKVDIKIRVGVHSGSVVAGLTGIVKIKYDIWSQTVDIANLIEQEGGPSQVHISQTTAKLLSNSNILKITPAKTVQINENQTIQTYFCSYDNEPLPTISLGSILRDNSIPTKLSLQALFRSEDVHHHHPISMSRSSSSHKGFLHFNSLLNLDIENDLQALDAVKDQRRNSLFNKFSQMENELSQSDCSNEGMENKVLAFVFASENKYQSIQRFYMTFKNECKGIFDNVDPLNSFIDSCRRNNEFILLFASAIYNIISLVLGTVTVICDPLLKSNYFGLLFNICHFSLQFIVCSTRVCCNSKAKAMQQKNKNLLMKIFTNPIIGTFCKVWLGWLNVIILIISFSDPTTFNTSAAYLASSHLFLFHVFFVGFEYRFIFASSMLMMTLSFFIFPYTTASGVYGHDYSMAAMVFKLSPSHYFFTTFVTAMLACFFLNDFYRCDFLIGQEIVLQLDQVKKTRDDFEKLAYNILPEYVFSRISKNPHKTFAEKYSNVFVAFIKVEDPKKEEMLVEHVEMLNQIFCCFDSYLSTYGVEKIKLTKQVYMIVVGAYLSLCEQLNYTEPGRRLLEYIFRICDIIESLNVVLNTKLDLKVGVHYGNVVGGVLGTVKLSFDIWGDTVNVAARLYQIGHKNEISMTESTLCALKPSLPPKCLVNGPDMRQIKGKGLVPIYSIPIAPKLLVKYINE